MHYPCIGLNSIHVNFLIINMISLFWIWYKTIIPRAIFNVGCHVCDKIFRGFQVVVKCYVNSISNNKKFT
jgi:hypothetical protein